MGSTPDSTRLDLDTLREIVEGTAAETGEAFFRTLVERLAAALRTKCAWVTEWHEAERRLSALAMWVDDRYVDDFNYDVANTPCEPVMDNRELVHVPDRVIDLYPEDPDLPPLGAVSYMGLPLLDTDGALLGHLAVLHDEPLPEDPGKVAVFNIFASRAAAELRRVRRDRSLREREQELTCLRDEIRALEGFDEIIGDSAALRRVLVDVDDVAGSDTTVLITGETGTGKELIARAIHQRSPRASKSLIKVNCAAIAATLQESEFFGHEPGAFTGATRRRDGRFKLADGGTIFLDEVGELPLDLQAKLLRVLQEGEFEPVGGTRTERVNVRVVAATNRDLDAMVKAGTFRKDLLYRLNVFPVEAPPLRERGDDVVTLAAAFARGFARRHGRPEPTLSPDDEAKLRRYDWPGNVRELQNVIERAMITAREGTLNLSRALPDAGPSSAPEESAPAPGDERILTETEMRDLERANIRRALAAADGKVSGQGGAAELLGLKPNTLSSRMKSLGIEGRRRAGGS
ncbi:MAG: sigma 54-interacting transcriptional regulator [Planctomycetota bacterium]|jgi:transcriptional regulator with GAF, ATPase, and Fis domain